MKTPLALCLAVVAALAGCASVAPDPVPAPPPAPTFVIVAPPRPAPLPRPVAEVVKQFRRASDSELSAVTKPHVTAQFVEQVHHAHVDASKAMTVLEREKRHPSRASLGNAQAAVGRLDDVLKSVPDNGP